MKSYLEEQGCTYRLSDDGDQQLLANFTARIDRETHYVDGQADQTVLALTGKQKKGVDKQGDPIYVDLPPVTINVNDFAAMNWVLGNWGIRCVIAPGQGVKDDLRTHIQLSSQPTVEYIYRRTGWQQIAGKTRYLHAGGAIGPKGNLPSVRVELPADLQYYRFEIDASIDPKAAIKATLALSCIGPPSITWPLLAATVAPLHGTCDFAVHLAGRTGSFKSELCSLFQSHYGKDMDARHLPGSWSSTPNALEALAWHAANALFVIDDFVPTGTSYQQRQYQVTADKIIRSQGNQSGRARLNDVSSLQQTMYPRGLILSTGEDTPEGHSVRARMLILDLSPDEIQPGPLSMAQAKRPMYPQTLMHYIAYLCDHPHETMTPEVEAIRANHLGVGHSRTPTMIARLISSLDHFLAWAATEIGYTKAQIAKLRAEALAGILAAAEQQTQHLETADPVDLFSNTIRSALASGAGYFRSSKGGVPRKPTQLGWIEVENGNDMPTYRPHGTLLGWADWDANELLFDVTGAWSVIRKLAGAEMTLTKQTLMKRLKEAGLVARSDDTRQRNTVRVQVDGHARQALCLKLANILEDQEKPAKPAN